MDGMEYDEFVSDLLLRSEELKLSNEHEKSIELLQKILVHEPDCFEALEEIGDNFLSMKQPEKAEKALRQAIKINPKSANAHYLLGFLFSQEQKWHASVEALETADNLSPNHPEILRCLGWSFYNQNRRSQQGVALLERSCSLSPNDPNILCDLGVCYMNSSQFRLANDLFEKVISMNPNSEQADECRRFLRVLNLRKKRDGSTER
ncbi:tetratricopeptide repeat protein [bacterium]|jgi:protein O-GlcNAc transferase|nr:tetratricopeptide repeat protein [bacterium]MBT6831497.1 tetratricopeptide repeat protein [bacterium]MBT6996051.1 tetratricopeptide repeat protein [bacterium]MBT7772172.1 tetratricopeptide repeat protein [bacterium]